MTDDRPELPRPASVAMLSIMETDADVQARDLESLRHTLKNRPKGAMRDFACQSVERLIAAHQAFRSALTPALRTVTRHEEAYEEPKE